MRLLHFHPDSANFNAVWTIAFPSDLFLSHRAKDKAVVRPLAEMLQQDGLKVWFNEWVLKPGDGIPAKIDEVLYLNGYC